ncbi:MAG: beta-galactosidase [Planctomycetes bacterium]|nr:beta-galactosidase [Planctomycetota bacterium]
MRLSAICASLLALAACSRGPDTPVAPVEPTPPAATAAMNPYAVCAHVGGHEHPLIDRELPLLREAGIGWVRTDFHWRQIEPKQGEWNFARLDATVAAAKRHGVSILPIITYVPTWAKPAGSHRPEWLEYVRRTVTRYKDDLRVWEIWNEPNLTYAWDIPDGKEYGKLLADTYRLIKSIDPGLTVLYGGTADIPWGFIEDSLKAGAAQSFDVMNVHPYRKPRDLHQLPADIAKLRDLLDRHGGGGRPLWFTELGWATQDGMPPMVAGAIKAGLAALDPDRTAWNAAVLDDPDYPARGHATDSAAWMLPEKTQQRRILLSDLAGLDPAREQALLLPPDEGFPVEAFEAIASYVERGGILVLTGGVPFYNEYHRIPGGWEMKRNAPDTWRARLRIGWDASWTKPGIVPAMADAKPEPRWASYYPVTSAQAQRATRFLTDAKLQPGDELIPLATAQKDGWSGTAAAAIRYAGRPGGVVVVPLMEMQPGVTQQEQGALLVAAMLHSFHAGVERFFWYELQATEGKTFDKEDHFGLLHADLSPKPAWHAYRTLIRMRPAGSTVVATSAPDATPVRWSWRRPDGVSVHALWRQSGDAVAQRLPAGVTEVCDFFGHPLTPAADGTVPVGATGVFIVGPAALDH